MTLVLANMHIKKDNTKLTDAVESMSQALIAPISLTINSLLLQKFLEKSL